METCGFRCGTKRPGGLSLGDWVQTQRRLRRGKYQFGVLTQQQIDKLNSIGWYGKPAPKQPGAEDLEAARRYYQQYGDLQVPVKYKDDMGFALGNWLNNIRARYRSGGLSQSQEDALEAMGIVWNAVDSRWECCYAEAARYYEQHGDLEFPKKLYNGYWTPAGSMAGESTSFLFKRNPACGKDPAAGGHRDAVGRPQRSPVAAGIRGSEKVFLHTWQSGSALRLSDAGGNPAWSVGCASKDDVQRKPFGQGQPL